LDQTGARQLDEEAKAYHAKDLLFKIERLSMRRILVPFRKPDRIKPYLEAAELAGLEPIPFPTDAPGSLDNVDGLLLTGGTDVDPARYGQTRLPETEEPDQERDEIELQLLDEAIERDLPILAICRGFQLLNVHQGGTLIQHIASGKHRVKTRDKGEPAHEVEVAPGSKLASIMSASRVAVNSRHHQAVDRVGANLQVVGRSVEDGIVEALERPGKRFVVAVQWHPENQVQRFAQQMALFQALRVATEGG
jgi:gamma-glutamyl-gamma-aminobutyrate hydrolase PuuD